VHAVDVVIDGARADNFKTIRHCRRQSSMGE
jgi:hypothetical protein